MQTSGAKGAGHEVNVISFLVELGIYTVLVTGYFFLVLHYLGGPLRYLFETSKVTYAGVSVGLMLGQGMVLQTVTSVLARLLERRSNRK
jgi:hypothetical protein